MTGALALRLRERFHDARADLFVRLVRPAAGSRLLDLGGANGEFSARIAARVPLRVTVADLTDDHRAAVLARGFEHRLLEAAPVLPFRTDEFDIVLCNSVIEHVTLPKDECRVAARVPQSDWHRRARAAQAGFAAEVMRVGRGYFVQTPHRHFPFEQHVHLPFVQYLTHNNACRVVALTDRFWIKSTLGNVDWELFTPEELHAMFPGANIHVERVLGLPKSIVAWSAPA